MTKAGARNLKQKFKGGRTPDRAGTSRRAGEPDPHPVHMIFRLYTDWLHTASGQLRASIRLALGWDVPHAFVFFAKYGMFHVLLFIRDVPCALVFLLNTGCSIYFYFFCKTWDVPCAFFVGCSMCFSFFLNTGCSMCFCVFAKHRMFHVLLFIRDVTVAKEYLIKIQARSVFSPIYLVLARTHRFRA